MKRRKKAEDEVIVISLSEGADVNEAKNAMIELVDKAGDLADRLRFKRPVSATFSGDDGTPFMKISNLGAESEEPEPGDVEANFERQVPGTLFLVLEDATGRRVRARMQIGAVNVN